MSPVQGRLDPGGTWAIIPVRGLERAKSRLGGPLDAEERHDLVSRLLSRALAAATGSSLVAGTIVVSSDPAALEIRGRPADGLWDFSQLLEKTGRIGGMR